MSTVREEAVIIPSNDPTSYLDSTTQINSDIVSVSNCDGGIELCNLDTANKISSVSSAELKRSSSLSSRVSSSSPTTDIEKPQTFQNTHLVHSNFTASLKSSQKLNRQLSEALLSNNGYNESSKSSDKTSISKGSRLFRLLKTEMILLLDTFSDQSGSLSNIRNGLSIVIVLGLTLGLSMPKNEDLPTAWYRYVSSIVGYMYFVSWSVSYSV